MHTDFKLVYFIQPKPREEADGLSACQYEWGWDGSDM